MLSVIADLLRVVLFEPAVASLVGAVLGGQPALGEELIDICKRESNCRLIGAHPADAGAGFTMHRNAMRVGWLERACPLHHGDPRRFSTRGVHGMSAAYSLRWLGPCVPPEALDIPLLSAIAATRRATHQCKKHGACDREGRRRQWAGARKYDARVARETATKRP